MTALISILAKATFVLAAGLLASAAARGAKASVRHLILASTFAALLILPFAAMMAPPNVIEIPRFGSDARPVEAPMSVPERAARQSPANTTAPFAPAAPTSVASKWKANDLLAAVWGAGALTLLIVLGRALFKLGEIRRNGLPWTDGEAAASAIAREKSLDRGVAVLLHENVSAPITCGVLRPLVVLPKDAPSWSEADLRRALVHELEHVRRFDWAIQLMARTASALYWFHPLAWVAWRKLCLEGERACDDAVLASAENADYADQLVSLAERMSGRDAQPVLSMANRSDLAVRVRAVLDRTQLRGRAGRSVVALTSLTAAVCVVLIGPLSVVQAAREKKIGAAFTSGGRTISINYLPGGVTSGGSGPSSGVYTSSGGSAPEAQEGRERREREVRERRERAEKERAEGKGNRVSRALGEALIEAAQDGDIEGVSELLAKGVDVNTVVGGDGTALIAASRGSQFEMAQLLIDRGADVNLGSDGDGTPLINAAREGSLTVVKLLLDRGADVDKGIEGDGNPLIAAAGAGRLHIVSYLVERGADIEAVVPSDENPLIKACEQGQLAIVKLLLGRGANIHARVWSDYGARGRGEWRTPVSMARRGGYNELVAYLLAQGAEDAPASQR